MIKTKISKKLLIISITLLLNFLSFRTFAENEFYTISKCGEYFAEGFVQKKINGSLVIIFDKGSESEITLTLPPP